MLWCLCLLWAAGALAAPLNKVRPKLLLISFDGFRWDYDRDVDTPNLDQMARDGVKAEYVTPPYISITSPAHFTLLTGERRASCAAGPVCGGGGVWSRTLRRLSADGVNHHCLAGRYVENHGVIHNMWFNTNTGQKKPYYQTLHVTEWWDNGTLPIWITAQRQVGAHFHPIPKNPSKVGGHHGYRSLGVNQEVEKESVCGSTS